MLDTSTGLSVRAKLQCRDSFIHTKQPVLVPSKWGFSEAGAKPLAADRCLVVCGAAAVAGEAVRQGRDSVVNEALTRVRRLLRQEAQTVTAAFQETDRQQAGLSSLQIVQLLKQQQLLPGNVSCYPTYSLVFRS